MNVPSPPKPPTATRLKVGNQQSEAPLRQCVRTSVDNYFRRCDGYEVSGLFELVMAEIEVPLLESVLEHVGGNRSRAAEVLGINRGTLNKKLKRYDLI